LVHCLGILFYLRFPLIASHFHLFLGILLSHHNLAWSLVASHFPPISPCILAWATHFSHVTSYLDPGNSHILHNIALLAQLFGPEIPGNFPLFTHLYVGFTMGASFSLGKFSSFYTTLRWILEIKSLLVARSSFLFIFTTSRSKTSLFARFSRSFSASFARARARTLVRSLARARSRGIFF